MNLYLEQKFLENEGQSSKVFSSTWTGSARLRFFLQKKDQITLIQKLR